MSEIGKYLIIIGIIITVIGLLIFFLGDKFSWFGNLPGDFKYNKGNVKVFFPFTSMIIISAIISLAIYLLRKL